MATAISGPTKPLLDILREPSRSCLRLKSNPRRKIGKGRHDATRLRFARCSHERDRCSRLDGRSTRHGSAEPGSKRVQCGQFQRRLGPLSQAGSRSGGRPASRRQRLQTGHPVFTCPGPRGRSSTLFATVSWRSIKTIGVCCRRPLTVFSTVHSTVFSSRGSLSVAITAAGGEFVSAREPDRARALKLLQQALPLVGNEPEHEAVAEFYLDFANTILTAHSGGESWKLQSLTDLSKLPDYSSTSGSGQGTVGAPVDADGNPVFYRAPARYDAAKSDGERWRWALAQVGASSPADKDRAALALANFLYQQFGVQTLANFRSLFDREDKAKAEANGPYAVETLKDDETIARLATGIKRFPLPDEFNFLHIYRDVAASGKKLEAQRALTTLAGIYENRRQYPRAAELWQECIRRFGPGDRGEHQQRLDQIVGNWGRFEPTGPLPATAGRTLGFRFRNGTRVELKAHALRVEKLLDDVKTYLKTGHPNFQWGEINVANIGYRLVVDNQSQYQGERVAEWNVTLQPPPDACGRPHRSCGPRAEGRGLLDHGEDGRRQHEPHCAVARRHGARAKNLRARAILFRRRCRERKSGRGGERRILRLQAVAGPARRNPRRDARFCRDDRRRRIGRPGPRRFAERAISGSPSRAARPGVWRSWVSRASGGETRSSRTLTTRTRLLPLRTGPSTVPARR